MHDRESPLTKVENEMEKTMENQIEIMDGMHGAVDFSGVYGHRTSAGRYLPHWRMTWKFQKSKWKLPPSWRVIKGLGIMGI